MASQSDRTDRPNFVICVVFKVKPEAQDEFRTAIRENAALSLAHEPGCQVFDVCESPSQPEFFLYEVYESDKAFADHLKAPHFLAFDQLVAPWVSEKKVSGYKLLPPHELSVG